MNILNCTVANCANNKNHLCRLDKITIEGPGACVHEQTCCANFIRAEEVTNAVLNPASINSKIICKAANCKYNQRGKCSKENVLVGKLSPESFVMGETECSSFNAR